MAEDMGEGSVPGRPVRVLLGYSNTGLPVYMRVLRFPFISYFFKGWSS